MRILRRKNDKCRLISNIALGKLDKSSLDTALRVRSVRGGFLSQPNYARILDFNHPEIMKMGELDVGLEKDFMLAWAVGSTSNSNTITLAKNNHLIGNGTGLQDRVGCCKLAVERAQGAGHDIKKAAAYSDSYFPFLDGPEILAKAGVKAILSSSGSVRDHEFIEFCQKNNIILYQLPDKEIRGFYGH
jgi:phosphoribosylaminoimidazolecarboxamide formyltransferase/IMP cyclohydrolase